MYGDRLPEPNETFFVNLSSATNATITDDEPRISINDVSKVEGRVKKTTLFVFTVTLSAAYDQAVTMSFQTASGTATTGDNDYVAQTGMLTFNPGETTKTITIEVKGDSKKEADETFYLDRAQQQRGLHQEPWHWHDPERRLIARLMKETGRWGPYRQASPHRPYIPGAPGLDTNPTRKF